MKNCDPDFYDRVIANNKATFSTIAPCGGDASRCLAPAGDTWDHACWYWKSEHHCPRTAAVEWADWKRRLIAADLNREREMAVERGIPERVAFDLFGSSEDTAFTLPPSFRRTTAFEAVVKHKGGILTLAGPKGTGKSTAACWWGCLMEALFRRTGEIARLNLFDREDRDHFEKLMKCSALIIDDFGTEYVDDCGIWAARFDELISARYDGGQRGGTILTTNLMPDTFQERVGPRVWDRLQELGQVVLCVGESLRGRSAP
jgi:DNA replication protein DnaC